MKTKTVLLISALTAIFAVSGCSIAPYFPDFPAEARCEPPAQPALPYLDKGELWDALGDREYRVVEDYIDRLWGYADEQAAMLEVICAD